jgi:predicted TIM-barrel fold metal-dependent hydrolase
MILDEIGYDRILFGSDYPTVEIGAQLNALKQVIPEERHEDVLGRNALRLGAMVGWWT